MALALAPACGRRDAGESAAVLPRPWEPPGPATLPPLPALTADPAPMLRVVRLLDSLPGARVDVPALAGPAAAQGPWVPVLAPDELSPPRAWSALGGEEPERDGRTLRVTSNAYAVVPAFPLARYRFTGRVLPGGEGISLDGDRAIAVPLLWELDAPWERERGSGAEAFGRSVVEVHRPTLGPREADGGRAFTIEFVALRATRHLALGLVAEGELREDRGSWPRPRREGVEREDAPRFGDLSIEVQKGSEGADPSEIRTFASAVAPGAPPLRGRITLGREARDCLLLPPPARARFVVPIPAGAVLDLATGVARDLSPDPRAPVSFRVSVEEGDRLTRVLDVPAGDPGDGARWTPRRVDLSAFGGRTVTVVIETEGQGGLAWAAVASPEIWAPDPTGAPPRTVLLVSVDTLRADRLGAYGHRHPTSPEIDRLAREGVLFEEHVAASNWTLPTHATMLTGLDPAAHRAGRWSAQVHEQNQAALPKEVPTVTDAFSAAGFRTQGIVAAPFLLPEFGFGRGFDAYDASAVHSAHHVAAHRDITAADVTARALLFLDENARRPVFLFLHHWDVHFEFLPPPDVLRAARPDFSRPIPTYDELYHGRGPVSPALEEVEEAVRRRRGGTRWEAAADALAERPRAREDLELLSALYDGEVRSVDGAIGQVLGRLREQGRWPGAIAVVTGDHGEEMYERGRMGHGGPLLYPEVHRTALVVRAPGAVPGRRVAGPTGTVDIAPTLLELAGIGRMDGLQGRSLAAAMRGEPLAPAPAICEDGGRGGVVVRDGGWGLVSLPGEQELYAVDSDRHWSHDVARAWPRVVAGLRRVAVDRFFGTAWGGVVALSGQGKGLSFEVDAAGLGDGARVWTWSSAPRGVPRRHARPDSVVVELAEGERALVVYEAGLPAPGALAVRRGGVPVPDDELRTPGPDPVRYAAAGTVQAFQRGPRGENAVAETAGSTREQLRALGYVE